MLIVIASTYFTILLIIFSIEQIISSYNKPHITVVAVPATIK
ncbi:hypothetical protein [Staphylococcus kloosii]|nr:hypothetical protein [Staphylococcus kloosii]